MNHSQNFFENFRNCVFMFKFQTFGKNRESKFYRVEREKPLDDIPTFGCEIARQFQALMAPKRCVPVTKGKKKNEFLLLIKKKDVLIHTYYFHLVHCITQIYGIKTMEKKPRVAHLSGFLSLESLQAYLTGMSNPIYHFIIFGSLSIFILKDQVKHLS